MSSPTFFLPFFFLLARVSLKLQVASRYCLICSWFVNFHFALIFFFFLSSAARRHTTLCCVSLIASKVCKVLHSRDSGRRRQWGGGWVEFSFLGGGKESRRTEKSLNWLLLFFFFPFWFSFLSHWFSSPLFFSFFFLLNLYTFAAPFSSSFDVKTWKLSYWTGMLVMNSVEGEKGEPSERAESREIANIRLC